MHLRSASRPLLLCLLAVSIFATDSPVSISSAGIITVRGPEVASSDMVWNGNGPRLENWPQISENGGYLVPAKVMLCWVLPEQFRVTYEYGSLHSLSPTQLPVPVLERMKSGNSAEPLDRAVSPSTWWRSETLSRQGPYELVSLTLFGARYVVEQNQWQVPTAPVMSIHTGVSGTGSFSFSSRTEVLNQRPAINQPQFLESQTTGLGIGKLKILVMDDGIYRVSYDSLKARYDDFTPVSDDIVSLMNNGRPVPIHIASGGDGEFGPGDYLTFLGHRNPSGIEDRYYNPYSDINVYWLDWENGHGLRLVEESGLRLQEEVPQITTFWETIHREEDLIFDRLGRVDTDLPTETRDHTFWATLNSGGTAEIAVDVPAPDRNSSENIQISIGLHGLTYSESGQAPHTVFAFINDNSIGEGSWVQQQAYTMTSSAALNLSHQILNSSGENTLSLFSPVSDEPGRYDRVVINWVEVSYERHLQVFEDALRFRKSFLNPNGLLEFEIEGMHSPDIVLLKEGVSLLRDFEIRENYEGDDLTYSIRFQDQVDSSTPDYWLASGEAILNPAAIVPDTLADLREADGDLVIITQPRFMAGLETYVEFKSEQGWQPILVSLIDIYDEFNHGVISPEAIKAFLRYAQQNWSLQPENVILVGDATSDPRSSRRDLAVNYTPTFYMQTVGWGAAEADYWYALTEFDDLIPEWHLGRLPVSSTEELELTLGKLMTYQLAEVPGLWQNDVLAIAGFESTFKYQSEDLLQHTVPDAFIPHRIFIDRDSEGQVHWGDTDSLLEQWNEGRLVINFLGHGGGAIWADRSLFTREDAARLLLDSPPSFVTSMTCFTGSFAQNRGLGEVLVAETEQGAVGWLGSSGVGWIINDFLMVQPILAELLSAGQTMGEALDAGRVAYYSAASSYEYLKPSMLHQYNFFGDPTVQMRLPEPGDLLSSAKGVYGNGEALEFDVNVTNEGELRYMLLGQNEQPLWSQPREATVFQGGSLIIDEPGLETGRSRLAYTFLPVLGPVTHGQVQFSISNDWIAHTPPATELEVDTPLQLIARIHAEGVVDSVRLQTTSPVSSTWHMDDIGSGQWRTPDSLKSFRAMGPLRYFIQAHFADGSYLQSESYTLPLPAGVNAALLSAAAAHQQGVLGVDVYLEWTGPSNASIGITLLDSAGASSRHFRKSFFVNPGLNKVFFPLVTPPGDHEIELVVHVDEDLVAADNEISTLIHPDRYQVLPTLGITRFGTSPDTLELEWGTLSASSPDTSWIMVERIDGALTAPGIQFLDAAPHYKVQINTNLIEVRIEPDTTLDMVLRPMGLANWIGVLGDAPHALSQSGEIALATVSDAAGPEVGLMIAGQRFFDGGYVDGEGEIHLVCEDENGFRWRREDVEILIDQEAMEVDLGDTTASGLTLTALARLDLSDGSHILRYRVQDALGNWSSSEEVNLQVVNDARILDYGNYPNPFTSRTTFIYELTQQLDDLVIDIYTLAGSKIHVIAETNAAVDLPLGAIGYHEVPWNGRDLYGDFVANGVYFYRIHGKNLDGNMVESSVGKVMKSR